jgi:hypothetical protein
MNEEMDSSMRTKLAWSLTDSDLLIVFEGFGFRKIASFPQASTNFPSAVSVQK